MDSMGGHRILVTGGAGFIGTNLVNELTSRGHQVTAEGLLNNERDGYVRCDLKNYYQLDRVLEKDDLDHAHHLAAADICLLPAKRSKVMENIVPIKMYEYLAAGKVVFATDLSGIHKEFKDGNGVIYLNESKDAISRAIDLKLSGAINSEGKKGQEFVRSNDWVLMVDDFYKVLKGVSNV